MFRKWDSGKNVDYLGQHFSDVLDLVTNFAHFIPCFCLSLTHFDDYCLNVSGSLVDPLSLLVDRCSHGSCLGLDFLEECFCGIELGSEGVAILFVSGGGWWFQMGEQVFLDERYGAVSYRARYHCGDLAG